MCSSDLRRKAGEDRYLFLEDGESEFGIYPFLHWTVPFAKAWGLGLGMRWDVIFNAPPYGQMAAAQAGLKWKWP